MKRNQKFFYAFNVFVTTALLQSLNSPVFGKLNEIVDLENLCFQSKSMISVSAEKQLFISSFAIELSDQNFDGFVILICRIIINNTHRERTSSKKNQIYPKNTNTEIFKVYYKNQYSLDELLISINLLENFLVSQKKLLFVICPFCTLHLMV